MSWDSYLDNLCAQSNDSTGKAHCGKAAIISLDGGASWTSPNHPYGIQLTPAEGQKIAQMMKSGDFSSAQANGIVLEGVKYQFLREDGKVAFAKKKGFGAITIQKSKSAVVIGHTLEGSQQGNTNKAVGVIADYLESVGM
ncbi:MULTISPECIES: profilin [Planktothrix]|uniref:profilin n=1 Tax=Planktothrix TaxID=54304 RepID=UPI00048505DA|nr:MULTISPECIES: profilin [Planktothrix]CAD5937247.1 Profilin [Planktothrix agardhii]SKB14711.1 Profilin [Planktothrix sp. PCC 11201]